MSEPAGRYKEKFQSGCTTAGEQGVHPVDSVQPPVVKHVTDEAVPQNATPPYPAQNALRTEPG